MVPNHVLYLLSYASIIRKHFFKNVALPTELQGVLLPWLDLNQRHTAYKAYNKKILLLLYVSLFFEQAYGVEPFPPLDKGCANRYTKAAFLSLTLQRYKKVF